MLALVVYPTVVHEVLYSTINYLIYLSRSMSETPITDCDDTGARPDGAACGGA
jgi:hypothetical protein